MPQKPPFDFLERNGYDNDFCGCCTDIKQCLMACFLPCIATGMLRGKLDGDNQFNYASCLCLPVGVYKNRLEIQNRYNHKESADATILAASCCACCAIAQDLHEYEVRTQPNNPAPPAAEAPPAP